LRWYRWLHATRPRRWAFLVLFTVVTRLPLLTYPKACDDEQVYSVVAVEMLHGGLPYIDAVERKPPLLFYLYQSILGIFGERNYLALHIASLAWTLATMAVLCGVWTRRFDVGTGWVVALLYAIFTAWANYTNLAFNGELLMNLPVAAAFAITLRNSPSRWRPELLIAGALVAIAFLLKQPSVVAGLPLAWYLLHDDYRGRHGLGWAQSLGQASLLLLGFVTTLLGAGLYLHHVGILAEAWYWTIGNHANPLGPTTWFFWHKLPARGALFVLETLPLLLVVAVSIRKGWAPNGIWKRSRAEFAALLVFLCVSCLGVAVNGQFNYHYFLQLVLPLVLLAAPVFTEIWGGMRTGHPRVLSPVFLARWLGLTALLFLTVDTIGLAQNRGPLPVAVYVREHSTPSDRIFMWGQGTAQTGIYLDAHRRPATRYIASFPLNGLIFGMFDVSYDTRDRIVPGAWDNLRQDFARHPPKFIIDCHEVRNGPLHKIRDHAYLRDLLATEFREVFRDEDGIVYQRWRPVPESGP
jgi:hypothetical protein